MVHPKLIKPKFYSGARGCVVTTSMPYDCFAGFGTSVTCWGCGIVNAGVLRELSGKPFVLELQGKLTTQSACTLGVPTLGVGKFDGVSPAPPPPSSARACPNGASKPRHSRL